MKVRHTLIVFFFLYLQDGNNGLVKAQVYSGAEGGDVRVKCPSSSFGSRKIFCKEPCEQEDILIERKKFKDQKGRYSIKWMRGSRDVYATIKQLTKSDSGLYRCVSRSSSQRIEVIVVDALLDGDPSEEKTLYSRTGGNVLVECFFDTSRSRTYFCKGECKDEDILVETTDFTAQRDRYSIRYVPGDPSGVFLYVGIKQLTMSDSGRYRCGLDRRLFTDPYHEFKIVVTDVPSASTATTTQSLNSTSGSSRPSSDSPITIEQSEMATKTRDVLLYVGLALVVMVMLSLSVLLFCRKQTSKHKEPPLETQYADVTETNRVYEDIREDGQSRSPPVEMSSVYSYAKYTEPNGAEINDDYSLITAANSQNTAEDVSSGLTYSEVNFSKQSVGSSSSSVRGDDNVVYSVPRVETLHEEDDPYSTVSAELQG
ncbi:uncharacterized protein LOC129100161 isoform X2 [Anoplopoma fimbria]|uniref:uncharacterized protein LOC129100161 isoform X2 n=1 Tax=Anoplopoma fimbria TaxID=229290 RepID=UPI0023EB5861|nr:uncharacterized protein LOC129100161 isoform X2 [Anoplopoma fimbria]